MTDVEATAAQLVARHARLIHASIARVAGPRAAAIRDDVVQRVAIALWQRVRAGRPIEHPAAYLRRCAIREAMRELARARDASEPIDDAVADRAPDPEHRLRGRELAAAVARCLDELAPERAAAVRAHLADHAVDEIMALHAWPYHKARNLVARGLADLRARLRDHQHPDERR